MTEIVAATKRHAMQLGKRGLRTADIVECRALGRGPKKAVKEAWEVSKMCWTLIDTDGRPLCLFGVAPHPTDLQLGIPWLLAAPEFWDHKRTLIENTPRYLARMHEQFPRLANLVHNDNRRSIQYLKWAGFTVSEEPKPFGPKNEPFRIFYRNQ